MYPPTTPIKRERADARPAGNPLYIIPAVIIACAFKAAQRQIIHLRDCHLLRIGDRPNAPLFYVFQWVARVGVVLFGMRKPEMVAARLGLAPDKDIYSFEV